MTYRPRHGINGGAWKLAALCQNPPRARNAMHARAQEAMRLKLALADTTAELVEAESEARVAGIAGRLQ